MADAAQCPVPAVRPVLVAASQFDAKNPAVAYYLRMHALNLLMAQTAQNPGVKPFLMSLLQRVETDKARIKDELASTDGRMALTDAALRLFTSADDLERSTAQPSEKAAQLFFVSSVLFEATGQFNSGQMDPIAAEKHKYARYVTALMRKSMTHGAPYTSPSGGVEAAQLEGLPSPNQSSPSLPSPPPQQHHQQQPPPQYHAPPSPPPPAPMYQPPQQQHAPQPPVYQAPAPAPTPAPAAAPPVQHYAPPAPAAPRMSARDGKAKTDRIIGAEKHARQAIAALQFFDENTARAQLLKALEFLDMEA